MSVVRRRVIVVARSGRKLPIREQRVTVLARISTTRRGVMSPRKPLLRPPRYSIWTSRAIDRETIGGPTGSGKRRMIDVTVRRGLQAEARKSRP